MTSSLLKGLLESGAPWGLLCAVLLAAVVVLWRRSITLSDKLYNLALMQVQKDEQLQAALQRLLEDVKEVRNRSHHL